MKSEIITGSVGTAMAVVGTATQTNEILQTISLVISILGGIVTFIVVPIMAWYKKANEDDKITKEEIKEGIDIVKKGTEKVRKIPNKEE